MQGEKRPLGLYARAGEFKPPVPNLYASGLYIHANWRHNNTTYLCKDRVSRCGTWTWGIGLG
jgi:hypothetical protein